MKKVFIFLSSFIKICSDFNEARDNVEKYQGDNRKGAKRLNNFHVRNAACWMQQQ